MYHRIQISPLPHRTDARGEGVCQQIREFLDLPVRGVKARDVFSLFADVSVEDARNIAREFTNPVLQTGKVGEDHRTHFDWVIAVGFLPGVTDNVASTARAAIKDIIGRPLRDDEHIYSSVEYLITGPQLRKSEVERIGYSLLANALINSVEIISEVDWKMEGMPINRPVYAMPEGEPALYENIDLEVDDDELQRLSATRTLALSLDEMQTIQRHFRKHGGEAERKAMGLSAQPSDVELEVLAQTWSEHCKHKIFDAIVEYIDESGEAETITSLFKSYIVQSTKDISKEVDWLVSVFKDNAGVIRFNDELNLVYKVETHNSPSALDPYGGAMTGIVGVNRDTMGTGIGAQLLINVWGYCFASPFSDPDEVPDGLFHPRRLRDNVHHGVIEGGNQSGIPYGLGWEYFDQRFLGKPLVFCGTVGLMPGKICGRPSHEKDIRPGDFIVMAGGRIGKDGIHGATFSSEELHQGSPVQAVQIGDPITQKMLYDFVLEAREQGLYGFIHDMGAGGLSSSIGEMSSHSGGCRLDLAKAPLKYPGLQPWEILLSEAQERMSLAVPPEKIDAFKALAAQRDVEVTVLGEFTDTGKFHITYGETTVAYLDLDFMESGYPRMQLKAEWEPSSHPEPDVACEEFDLGTALIDMLGRLNIGSCEEKARQYDHEVKGLNVAKPFCGVNGDVQADAAVFLAEPGKLEAVVLASGVAPRYSDIDTYHMAASVIDMAVRRTIAVGGKLGHISGLDNFCWPDPVESEKTPDGRYKMAQLVRANKALFDYTKAFQVPCISGKDSMKNDSTRGGRKISIPPTLLFSTMARMADASKSVTLDLKRANDLVYVIGETHKELGGSEYYAMLGYTGNDVPKVDADKAKAIYEAVSQATEAELCHALHAPVIGGLGVAFAKMAVGGCLGVDIDITKIPAATELTVPELLFSESNSRLVAAIPAVNQKRFEEILKDVPHAQVGVVKYEPNLTFYSAGAFESEIPVADLRDAYRQTFSRQPKTPPVAAAPDPEIPPAPEPKAERRLTFRKA